MDLHGLSSSSLETRLYSLQALQETLLRTEDANGGFDAALSALSSCWRDFAALTEPNEARDKDYASFSRRRAPDAPAGSIESFGPGGRAGGSWTQLEQDTLYALLRCSNAVLDADPEGGYALYFAKPSVLVPLRVALSQNPQDTELLFEAMKLLNVVADKFPLSFLRSRIAHDLIANNYLFTRLPIRSKHALLSMCYAAASVIATREDSALLLMLIPSLKALSCVPTAREISAATAGAAYFPAHLEENIVAADHSSSEGGAAAVTGPSSSAAVPSLPRTSETLQESFTRELALRVIIRTLLISVGLCQFSVDTSVSVHPMHGRTPLRPAIRGGGEAAPRTAAYAEQGSKHKPEGASEAQLAAGSSASSAAAPAPSPPSSSQSPSSSSAAARRRKEAIKRMEKEVTGKPEWPRKAVGFLLKKMQLVPFLVRALTASTTLSVVPVAGARSSPRGEASSAADGSAASLSDAYSYGPVLMRLTTYGIRCIIRVLIRTLALVEADTNKGASDGSSSGELLEAASCWPERSLLEIRAACARLVATAPLASYPNSLEREEAFEMVDDCNVFLLFIERMQRTRGAPALAAAEAVDTKASGSS